MISLVKSALSHKSYLQRTFLKQLRVSQSIELKNLLVHEFCSAKPEKSKFGASEEAVDNTSADLLNYSELLVRFPDLVDCSTSLNSNCRTRVVNEGAAQVITELHTTYDSENAPNVALKQFPYKKNAIFMRDMNTLIYSVYAEELRKQDQKFKGLRILDTYPGSGMSVFRLLAEMKPEDIHKITVADEYGAFSALSKENLTINRISTKTPRLEVLRKSANAIMFERSDFHLDATEKGPRFNVIDLNNYGSPMEYLDFAFMSIEENGLLGVTFSDFKSVTGMDQSKLFYKYGVLNSPSDNYLEVGFRVALNCLNKAASKYNKEITPIIYFFSDYYLRIYIQVTTAKKEELSPNSAIVLKCSKCPNFHVKPLLANKHKHGLVIDPHDANCNVCESPYTISGPIWNSQLSDPNFVRNIAEAFKALPSSLKGKLDEKKIDTIIKNLLKEREIANQPLSYDFLEISKYIKCPRLPPKYLLKRAYTNAGYKLYKSPHSKDNWFTDAPSTFVFDVLKAWKSKLVPSTTQLEDIEKDTPLYKYLSKKMKFRPSFAAIKGVNYAEDSDDN